MVKLKKPSYVTAKTVKWLKVQSLAGTVLCRNTNLKLAVDVAIRRFKRSCEKAGVLADVRKREFYEKPTQERKRKKAAAVKRYQKKLARESVRTTRLY